MNKFEIDNADWLSAVPGSSRKVIASMLAAGKTPEEVAERWLNQVGSVSNAGFGAGESVAAYFLKVRAEMDAFICGDKRYAEQRKHAALLWEKQGRNVVVSYVAVCIGTNVGLAAVALVPVIALLFSTVGKIGIEAYCKV